MAMLKAKVQGLFTKKLNARIEAWNGAPKSGAQLYAPDELSWWYFQEYGTANKGVHGGATYPIEPVDAKELVFPGPGGAGVTRTHHVDHPGIPPRKAITQVLPQIQDNIKKLIRQSLADGGVDQPGLIKDAVLQAAEDAKALIVESIAEHIPGTRSGTEDIPAGRLHGSTAASVFADLSTIVDTTTE